MSDLKKNVLIAGLGAAVVAGTVGYLVGRKTTDEKPPTTNNKASLWKMQENEEGDTLLNYIKKHCTDIHPVQKELISQTRDTPMSVMLASADELQLLQSIVVAIGAKKTLDIGTYTGYSALSIALGLPDDGKVITCDVNEEYVNVGRPYWKKAGVDHKIVSRLAPATETLDKLIQNGEAETFDFAFIDADKENYVAYYERCLKLIRKGGIIAVDNVLWNGDVIDPSNNESETLGIRALNDVIAQDPRVTATMLQLADGTTIAVKK